MLDIHKIMRELAQCHPRRIFHSEADFQHEFAWKLHKLDNEVRLEYPFTSNKKGKRQYLDIWLPKMGVAIELKYHTSELNTPLSESVESFQLTGQARGPQLRYDFCKDVMRLENLNLPDYKVGFAILLTNSRALWNLPGNQPIVDKCFRLHEERKIIKGTLKWGPKKSKQEEEGSRVCAICLKGSYRPEWKDFLTLAKPKHGLFRYLAFQVPSPESEGGT